MLTCGELVELSYTLINKVLYFILSPLKMVLNSEFLHSEYDKLDVQHKYDLMVLQKTKFKNKYLKQKRKTKNLKKRLSKESIKLLFDQLEKTDINNEKYDLMIVQKIKFKNKYLKQNKKVKVLKGKLDKLRKVLQITDNNLAIAISQFDELQNTYLFDYQSDDNIMLELLYKMKYDEKNDKNIIHELLNDQEINDLNEKLIDQEIKENEKVESENEKVESEKLNERMRKWHYENLEKTVNKNEDVNEENIKKSINEKIKLLYKSYDNTIMGSLRNIPHDTEIKYWLSNRIYKYFGFNEDEIKFIENEYRNFLN